MLNVLALKNQEREMIEGSKVDLASVSPATLQIVQIRTSYAPPCLHLLNIISVSYTVPYSREV